MKTQIAKRLLAASGLLALVCFSAPVHSQWSLSGNALGGGDFLGSTNTSDIIIKSNTTEEIFRFVHGGDLDWKDGNIFKINNVPFLKAPSTSTFIGLDAGNNSSGQHNVFLGYQSGYNNTSGYINVFLGTGAGYANISAPANVFIGYHAGANLRSGSGGNTFVGESTGYYDSIGAANTFIGMQAGVNNKTGEGNTFIGYLSATNNLTGTHNATLGGYAEVSTSNLTNATAIGYNSVVNASNKIRLGDAGVTVVEGPVAYTVSDGRFKTNISESDVKGLAFIKKLRPVVYNFDTRQLEDFLSKNMPEADRQMRLSRDFSASTKIRQSGFIAQEVEKAAEASGYDFNGVHHPESENDNYSLAYGQFVVPLVKGMQEQQAIIEQQQQQIDALQKSVELLRMQIGGTIKTNGVPVLVDLNIYPNPGSGLFTVKTENIATGTIEVYDMAGKMVYQTELKNGIYDYQLNLAGLRTGNYMVKLSSSGKEMISKQLIVE